MSELSESERRLLFDYIHPGCGHSIKVHNKRACEECSCSTGSEFLLICAVEALVAARVAEALAPVAALCAEAITQVASASHSHWREGGITGTCRTCQAASERAAELHARLRALAADRAEGEHACGHALKVTGCGGCDPGAIEFVINDDGTTEPFDPALHMKDPETGRTFVPCNNREPHGRHENEARNGTHICPGRAEGAGQ